MKTTKSTKALVTLLVVIILLALAGNYLENANGNANPAAVSRSLTKPSIFSTIRGWFTPIQGPASSPTPYTECWELAIGDMGGIIENQGSFNQCVTWAQTTRLFCHACCVQYYGTGGGLTSCENGCRRDGEKYIEDMCCSDYSHGPTSLCPGSGGTPKQMQPIYDEGDGEVH